jgi:hypothetical protein
MGVGLVVRHCKYKCVVVEACHKVRFFSKHINPANTTNSAYQPIQVLHFSFKHFSLLGCVGLAATRFAARLRPCEWGLREASGYRQRRRDSIKDDGRSMRCVSVIGPSHPLLINLHALADPPHLSLARVEML